MANSLPFNSISKDRVYKAEDWAWYFATFIGNGIFPQPSTGLQIMAKGKMTLTIMSGYAFINGYAFRNAADSDITLELANGSLPRIDRIVVRWDLTNRDIYISILKGETSAKPTAARITRDAEVYELVIADIYVGKGVTSITQADITDQRFNTSLCGIVKGTVDQIDASALTAQFESFFAQYKQKIIEQYNNYLIGMDKKEQQADTELKSFKQNVINKYKEYLVAIGTNEQLVVDELENFKKALNDYEKEQKENFEAWFETIKGLLNEDAAGNLQNQLNKIDTEKASIAIYGDTAITLGSRASGSVVGTNSISIGDLNTASKTLSVAVGDGATVTANNSFALGRDAAATNTYSYALGKNATASGKNSCAIGTESITLGENSFSIGYGCSDIIYEGAPTYKLVRADFPDFVNSYQVSGYNVKYFLSATKDDIPWGSYYLGVYNNHHSTFDFFKCISSITNDGFYEMEVDISDGDYQVEDYDIGDVDLFTLEYPKTPAVGAFAQGYSTKAGNYAHSQNYCTQANHDYQTAIGKYNKNKENSIFEVGYGTESATDNVFRITTKGATYADGAYSSTGADYAEYFEWLDGNLENEDRRGYFVTLDGDKIRLATSQDDYILGIVSAQPCVIGNSDEDWRNKYLTDDFGEYIYQKVDITNAIYDKEKLMGYSIRTVKQKVLNPEYDKNIEYISRKDRPEWSLVGMLGVLTIYDDSTCKVNGYACCSDGGTATACEKKENSYRVMSRVNDNLIKILVK